MSVLFVVLAIAAAITSLACLGTAHRVAAVVAALVGLGAFLLANVPVPDGVAAATPSEQNTFRPDASHGCGDNQCR